MLDKLRKRTKKVLVLCATIILMCAIAIGDAETVAEEPAGSSAGLSSNPGSDVQSLTFQKDWSIRDALRFLSVTYQKNIVPTPNVDGKLAFTRLANVTFEEAMDAIIGMNLRYEVKGQLVKVYTKDEYKKVMEDKERMVYKTFTLYYISSTEAEKLVAPVLSGAGMIRASTAAESVVPTGASISAAAGGGNDMASNETLVILDYPEKIAQAAVLLKELDKRPRQVLIEATILSATLIEGMEFGVDLNFAAGVHIDGSEATPDLVSGDTVSRGTNASDPISQIAGGISGTPLETAGFAKVGSGLRIGVTSGDFSAFITALEQVTDTTILANPKILAVNKQLGQVYIGNKIGYISQTNQTQTSTTQQVEFLETGTKLAFRPFIGDDGYIRMQIYPKDSSGTLKTNSIPDESATELATNIMVKDGETVVIGGLFRDVVVTSRNQIPILGDLPLLGGLFRGSSDSTVRQEVIILLTTHIIEDPSETNGNARVQDMERKRFGAKDALQWTGRSRLAEDRYSKAAKLYIEGMKEAALCEVNKALELRPTYLEAIRLKEKLLAETSTEGAAPLERNIIEQVEAEDSQMWQRR